VSLPWLSVPPVGAAAPPPLAAVFVPVPAPPVPELLGAVVVDGAVVVPDEAFVPDVVPVEPVVPLVPAVAVGVGVGVAVAEPVLELDGAGGASGELGIGASAGGVGA
jgi:hypothetical protein